MQARPEPERGKATFPKISETNPYVAAREKKRGETYSNSFTTKSAFSSIKAGDYGGNVTISLLEVDVRAEHHGSMFVCEAKNEALGQSVHNAMTISVNCEFRDSCLDRCGKIGGRGGPRSA